MLHTSWKKMDLEQLNEGLTRQMISGEDATVARIFLVKGVLVPRHSHRSEQFSLILSGALRFVFDDNREVDVRAGELMYIPAHEPHKAIALEDTEDIDFFAPPRQDWITKNDAYLRGKK